ncbi:siderophore iron transporter mirB [Microdochium bolleyi]|uniref:Siderophore iron transporter mirB n=1 Tax=Microdochium bolleyi TaxID=196109 RepID=A0A136IN18_9PEZI|nr:siderophore iron transporter mirB [Microdochium bolleyi]
MYPRSGGAQVADSADHDTGRSSDDKSPPAHQVTSRDEAVDATAQSGVQGMEAIAIAWSKPALIVFYVLVWVVYLVSAICTTCMAALAPYVTSSFMLHSLTPTVSIISTVAVGVCNLSTAKILDVIGRPQGYALGLFVTLIGLIMMAATTSVEMYAAAQVFWSVGSSVLGFTLGILVADTTTLKNRALMLVAEAFLAGLGWEWCSGMYSIVLPVVGTPLLALLCYYAMRAKKLQIAAHSTVSTQPSRTMLQKVKHYVLQFDLAGILLLTTGLALFLLPFNLYGMQPEGWASPLIIGFLVAGFVLMAGFALYEAYLSPVCFIEVQILMDRNVVGAGILGAVLFFSNYAWASYFSSFLQVVNGLSVTHASYVMSISNVAWPVASVLSGVYINRTGRYKYITLASVLLYMFATGLMIYFRRPEHSIGYLIMCQIFIGVALGSIMTTPVIAAMSSLPHQQVAVVTAIISMFSSIGGAIGLTVAGAIWAAVFPARLALYLPSDEFVNLVDIYASIKVQLSYPEGTAARVAIQQAYADAQTLMLSAATAAWVIGIAATLAWRNTDVRNIKQVRGQVF